MGLIVKSLWPKCCSPNGHTPLYPTPVVTGFQPGLYHTQIEYWPQTVPLTMCVKCKGTQHYLSHWELQTTNAHNGLSLPVYLGVFTATVQLLLKVTKQEKNFASQGSWRILRVYSLSKYNHLKLLSEILKRNVLSSFPHSWTWLFFPSSASEQLVRTWEANNVM